MNKTKLAPLTAIVLAMLLSCSSNEDMPPDPNKNQEQTYDYCVISTAGWCLEGPFTAEVCGNNGGMPSNNCPYNTLVPASSSSSFFTGLSSSGSSSSSYISSSSLNYSSSSSEVSSSSSSIDLSSSSSIGNIGGGTYESVTIGTQVWMKKNLNIDVTGSKCYDNDPANCDKYGRLYDWATAMGFESSCNYNCSSQINAKHQGICPTGWHIPSDMEWSILINYVDGIDDNTRRDGPTVGTILKAKSGWNSYSGVTNGTDEYGFAALPGGCYYSDGHFSDVGYYGYWWSASEYYGVNAYSRGMYYDGEVASWGINYKTLLYSVRCVQD